ncbi:hypothetical protein N7U66_17810 [Lacinutrix neustonica]|uniref:Uncharacterized protein n=1 Tax=Lacinutrix neustonica TaxID=2980107 RepID=A0A9E8SGH1_9FLAO|nr:hypothetical protein [Lacinutrix neustonica]WAC01730.1 hypothetical protein N7U66_17810 [Lacinutrix neustonica]
MTCNKTSFYFFNKIVVLSIIIIFFSCKKSKIENEKVITPKLKISNYIKQDSVSTLVFEKLEEFLLIKNQDFRSSKYWSDLDFEHYIFPYNDIVNIEMSKEGESIYEPKVLELLHIEGTNEYIVKIAFLKYSNQELGIKCIYNLIFDIKEQKFKRILNYNTRNWKKIDVGDIEYYISPLREFNITEALEFDYANKKIAQLFEMESKSVKYYSCISPVELFEIKGFDYIHNMYMSDKGGLSEVTSNILFSGNDSDTYNHEIVHFYTYEKYYSTIGNLSLINEGLATFIGGSGEASYSVLRKKLMLFLEKESIDVNGYLYPYSNDEMRNEIAYTIGAILCERSLRLYGRSSFLDIFYAKNLQEVMIYLNINEANLVMELKNELKNEPIELLW